MSKIPCRKCDNCGLYHDLSFTVCSECGKDLINIPAILIDTESIPAEEYGEINENVCYYYQKCSACGTVNYTSDINSRVKVCYNCHKTRISSIEPTIFNPENGTVANESTMSESEKISYSEEKNVRQDAIATNNSMDEIEDDAEVAQWQGLLGNIKKSLGYSDDMNTQQNNTNEGNKDNEDEMSQTKPEDNEDDNYEEIEWAYILGGKPEQKKETISTNKSDITLTALRYGRLSFTITAEKDSPYLLGRSANQSSFLSNDGRVGNEHCYLIFKDGIWFVKDNNSANGTAVNSRDIGMNGEQALADGDELKLGHHQDSMAFKITINNGL